MKKTVIIHLLASNKFSGAENVVCTIIENVKENYEMYYCSPSGSIKETLKEKDINYIEMQKFNTKELNKIIEKYNPDIIHAHDYRASILAVFSKFQGKIISHLHNNCPFAKNWNIRTLLYNVALNRINYVVGVSNKVYEEAIFKKRLKGKYTTIYNWVNQDRIVMLSKEKTSSSHYDLYFIGRLTEQKNPQMFIEIVKEVKKEIANISAVMIGDGELRKNCEELIKQYELENNIQITGFLENPFPIIKNSQIGIMPSRWEGFGLTAIESIALNKIVLNSGVGGLGEIFQNLPELQLNKVSEYKCKIIELLKENKVQNKYKEEYAQILKKFCDKKQWKENLLEIYNK